MKCYICGTEFSEDHGSCPSCGTKYAFDLKKALENPVERYRGIRSDGFEMAAPPPKRHDPTYAASLLQQGLEKARAGDFVGAESVLREAQPWDEENAEILFYWGSALFKLGRYLEAKSAWERAAQQEPDNPKYRRWLQKVEAVLSEDF